MEIMEHGRIAEIKTKSFNFCVAAYSILSSVMTAYAAGTAGAIEEGVKSGLKEVYNILTAIILPIGVVALGVCAVKIVWGNQKSAEEGKSALVRIVIGLALIFIAPLLVEQIAGWFQNLGTGGIF